MTLGGRIHFEEVNEAGGIHGRKIRLIARDDGYEPTRTIECVNELIREDGVFALGFFVGTPTGVKAGAMAQRRKVPLFGLMTGAEPLRHPVKRYLLHVRASYYDETRAMIDGLVGVGKDRIAVFHQDDAFGRAVLKGVRIALAEHGREPVALGRFARSTMDVAAGLSEIEASKPDAVVLVGTYAPLAKFVDEGRQRGLDALFLNVSFVGTKAFAEAAGAAGEGVVVTQVVPSPNRRDLPAVAEYHAALARFGQGAAPNFVSLEGYVTARVLVEGLRRAGPALTRESFVDAVEAMAGVDVGLGPLTAYSPDYHQAFGKVFPTVLRGGEAVVFDDWSEVVHAPASAK